VKAQNWKPFALPLPAFVLHPVTALVIACMHVYLAAGHLSKLFGGDLEWTHIWKGFGALAGAYVFTAFASHRLAHHSEAEAARRGIGAGARNIKVEGCGGRE
jgi:hypothetical protein